jgi:serine/threonine protein kinase
VFLLFGQVMVFEHLISVFFTSITLKQLNVSYFPSLHRLFSPENEDGIFDAVLHSHIDFSSDPWPSISNGAKDLVKKMLRQDPKERLTAAEILSKATGLPLLCMSSCVFTFHTTVTVFSCVENKHSCSNLVAIGCNHSS